MSSKKQSFYPFLFCAIFLNMSNHDVEHKKDLILLRALEDVPFDGWNKDLIEHAAKDIDLEAGLTRILFPSGVDDLLSHFSDWADRQMLEALSGIDPEELRVRDRIKTAVLKRLEILQPHQDAVRSSLSHWALPFRQLRAGKILWRSADRIWNWAGDISTDYNHYTKRTLLSGVMASTTMFWLQDNSGDGVATEKFLDRRIENVMQIGKITGKIKKATTK